MKPSAARYLQVLEEHPEGVTQLEALLWYGCGDSMAQRVHEIRAEGHDIRGAYETTAKGARVMRYRLVRPSFALTTGTQEAMTW